MLYSNPILWTKVYILRPYWMTSPRQNTYNGLWETFSKLPDKIFYTKNQTVGQRNIMEDISIKPAKQDEDDEEESAFIVSWLYKNTSYMTTIPLLPSKMGEYPEASFICN